MFNKKQMRKAHHFLQTLVTQAQCIKQNACTCHARHAIPQKNTLKNVHKELRLHYVVSYVAFQIGYVWVKPGFHPKALLQCCYKHRDLVESQHGYWHVALNFAAPHKPYFTCFTKWYRDTLFMQC